MLSRDWRVLAVEVLAHPWPGPVAGLLIVHVELDGAPETVIPAIAGLARLNPHGGGNLTARTRHDVETLIADVLPGARLCDSRTGYVITHVAFPDSPPAGPISGSEAEPTLQWARVLAHANGTDALPGDLLSARRQACDIPLSASWEACVVRSGASFVGRTGTKHDPFHELARVLVHSIYLDALLLGLIQRYCIEDIANSMDALWERDSSARHEIQFEKRMIQFRSQVWWSEVSPGQHADRLLQAFQAANDLKERQDRLHVDISDASRLMAGERVERTNTLLNTIVVMSFGFGLAALISDPGPGAVAVGSALALGAWLTLRLWERRDR